MELRGQSSEFYGSFSTIYALVNPQGIRFYVGVSFNPERRLKEHLKDAKERYELFLTEKIRIIRSANYDINFEVLEIVWTTGLNHYDAAKKAQKTEEKWIKKLLKDGHPLTNMIPLRRAFAEKEDQKRIKFNREYQFWKQNYNI